MLYYLIWPVFVCVPREPRDSSAAGVGGYLQVPHHVHREREAEDEAGQADDEQRHLDRTGILKFRVHYSD